MSIISMDVKEAALKLGYSRNYIKTLIRRGRFGEHAWKKNDTGKWLLDKAMVDAIMDNTVSMGKAKELPNLDLTKGVTTHGRKLDL